MIALHPYPAFKIATLLILGILLGRAAELPLVVWLGLSGVALLVLTLLLALRPGSVPAFATLTAMGLCIFLGGAKSVVDTRSPAEISNAILEHEALLVGTITEEPKKIGNRTRFVVGGAWFLIESEPRPFEANILVTLKRARSDSTDIVLRYGMKLGVRGLVTRPSEERNPGEFSPRQYLAANGIECLMDVRGNSAVLVLDTVGGSWLMREMILPLRRHMLRQIDLTIGGEEGEFLKGLLIGERSGLSPELREAFTNSGVAHVLAVSGSNVAVVATFVFFLLEFLRIGRATRVLVTCLGLLLYMMLTGSQPPVVRATVMALVFLLGRMVQENANGINSLGVAAVIILGYDAGQLFDVGFQLSFIAVLSILYLYPKVNSWISILHDRNVWWRLLIWTLRVCAVSLVATLGTLPLTAVYFGRVSVIGLLANVAVIPATGGSVVLGFTSLIASLVSDWVAHVYAAVNQLLLSVTIDLAVFSANVPFAYIDTLRFTPLDALPFYAFLMFVFHLSLRSVARPFFILLLVSLNLWVWHPRPVLMAPPVAKMRVSFIDVGQGDAVLTEFPDGKTMLVDAGPRSGTFDSGERTVIPFLRRRGISTIDLLVVSHPHGDHIGGVASILEGLDVKRVVDCGQSVRSGLYREYRKKVNEEQCLYGAAGAGMMMEDFTGARLYVLGPSASFLSEDTTGRHPNLNNTSVVLKLQYGEVSFMLTGDAEEEAEAAMRSIYGAFLSSTVLKVGHHGSNTSTTQAFLMAVRPLEAVVSVGRNNRFGHPSPLVLERLTQGQVVVSRTDERGAIIFETEGRTLSRINWR